ncbi:hypothetical protein JCM10908_006292 [Rhodotorula pacifica]|uniref:uncharacterized protein n=1 Tax=Rhodotorula pacifica TaxID=1495444 RepID=UPI0031755B7D
MGLFGSITTQNLASILSYSILPTLKFNINSSRNASMGKLSFKVPTPLPVNAHLRGTDNYDVWTIQLRTLVGEDACRLLDGLVRDNDTMEQTVFSLRLKSLPTISYLLGNPRATKATLRFLADSGRFDSLFCPPLDDLPPTKDGPKATSCVQGTKEKKKGTNRSQIC